MLRGYQDFNKIARLKSHQYWISPSIVICMLTVKLDIPFEIHIQSILRQEQTFRSLHVRRRGDLAIIHTFRTLQAQVQTPNMEVQTH